MSHASSPNRPFSCASRRCYLECWGFYPGLTAPGNSWASCRGALGEHGRRDLAREVSGLARDFRSQLRILEEAYVGSRYLAREYAPEDASESVDLVGRVCRLIDRSSEEVFCD
ncbi:MAG: HEPN domain-containing protein [Candidatus Korarchaeota archaeon]|nr:HEPN domain-containing protein [Candidatus Korarchaeota archaeon]